MIQLVTWKTRRCRRQPFAGSANKPSQAQEEGKRAARGKVRETADPVHRFWLHHDPPFRWHRPSAGDTSTKGGRNRRHMQKCQVPRLDHSMDEEPHAAVRALARRGFQPAFATLIRVKRADTSQRAGSNAAGHRFATPALPRRTALGRGCFRCWPPHCSRCTPAHAGRRQRLPPPDRQQAEHPTTTAPAAASAEFPPRARRTETGWLKVTGFKNRPRR